MKLSHFVELYLRFRHSQPAGTIVALDSLQERLALSLTLEGGPVMLMRNPEYQIENAQECRRQIGEPFVVHTSREMLLGQLVVILLLVIAILLRALS